MITNWTKAKNAVGFTVDRSKHNWIRKKLYLR